MMYACVAFCDINRYKWNGLVLTSDQAMPGQVITGQQVHI